MVKHATGESFNFTKRPDWVYRLSSDFIVGIGSGETIGEAQNAAISDLKTKIAKAMGESVSVLQYSAIGNKATSRYHVDSESVFLLRNQLKNYYEPVIEFNYEKVLDIYYELSENHYNYFIKYFITKDMIDQIKNKSTEKEQQIKSLIKNLSIIDDITSVEGLLARHEELIILYNSRTPLNSADSFRIVQSFNKLISIIDGLTIQKTSQDSRELRFCITSMGKKYTVLSSPLLTASDNIDIQSVTRNDDLWTIRYEFRSPSALREMLEIRFKLYGLDIVEQISLDNPAKSIRKEPGIKKVLNTKNLTMTITDMNRWNELVRGLQLEFCVETNNKVELIQAEFELVNAFGQKAILLCSIADTELRSDSNCRIINLKTEMSARYLRSVQSVNARLTYKDNGRITSGTCFNVPFKILNQKP